MFPAKMVLGAGLEPACLSAYAPQTYVSAIPPPELNARASNFPHPAGACKWRLSSWQCSHGRSVKTTPTYEIPMIRDYVLEFEHEHEHDQRTRLDENRSAYSHSR